MIVSCFDWRGRCGSDGCWGSWTVYRSASWSVDGAKELLLLVVVVV